MKGKTPKLYDFPFGKRMKNLLIGLMKVAITKSTKNARFKYPLLIFLLFFFFLGTSNYSALAYSINLTIDAIEDAGLSPLQNAFARFIDINNGGVLDIPSPTGNQWSSANDVYNYVSLKGISNWVLEAAGNIWSNNTTVGESLTGLSAGTYRISVVSGAFEYDFFNWSPYYGEYRWQLHIQGRSPTGVPIGSDQILGSTDPYLLASLALSDNLGKSTDIYIPYGGSLAFWIWDWNSLDNAGSLTVNVTLIPEPATFILLGTGVLFLAKRFRRPSPHH